MLFRYLPRLYFLCPFSITTPCKVRPCSDFVVRCYTDSVMPSFSLCFLTEKYNSIVNRSEWRAIDVDCYLLWKPYDLMQLKIDTFSPNTFRARVKLQLDCCALFDIKPFANRFNEMNETDWIRMMNWLVFKMRFETLLPLRRSFKQKPKP